MCLSDFKKQPLKQEDFWLRCRGNSISFFKFKKDFVLWVEVSFLMTVSDVRGYIHVSPQCFQSNIRKNLRKNIWLEYFYNTGSYYAQQVNRMQMQQKTMRPIVPKPIKHHPTMSAGNPSRIAVSLNQPFSTSIKMPIPTQAAKIKFMITTVAVLHMRYIHRSIHNETQRTILNQASLWKKWRGVSTTFFCLKEEWTNKKSFLFFTKKVRLSYFSLCFFWPSLQTAKQQCWKLEWYSLVSSQNIPHIFHSPFGSVKKKKSECLRVIWHETIRNLTTLSANSWIFDGSFFLRDSSVTRSFFVPTTRIGASVFSRMASAH